MFIAGCIIDFLCIIIACFWLWDNASDRVFLEKNRDYLKESDRDKDIAVALVLANRISGVELELRKNEDNQLKAYAMLFAGILFGAFLTIHALLWMQ
jgi:hypothetical protein